MRKDIQNLVKKYEEKLLSGASMYFDADEFEDLAEYYDSQEKIEAARVVIKTGLKIHPESQSLLLKKAKFSAYDGDYTRALSLLNSTSNEYDFDLYLLKVECYLQLGLQTEAYETIKIILESEEEYIDNALAEIGFLYIDIDGFEEAILYLEKSLEYNRDNTDVLGDLAYAYEMQEQFDKSIATNNRILDIDAYSYEAWINIGRLHSIMDEFEKAVDAFDFALTIDDSDQNVYKLKAHCLSLCGRSEDAVAIFMDLLAEMPEDASLYFLLSECYFALDMYEEALENLDIYEKMEGFSLDVLSKKAYIYLKKEDFKTALDVITEAYDSNPESPELNTIMGEINFKQELYDEAEKYFRLAYVHHSDRSHLVDRLSILNLKKEDYPEALKFSKELLELEPYSLAAKQRLTLLYFELDDKDGFNMLLDQFSDEDLQSLFNLIYDKEMGSALSRDILIGYLVEARECRILFKNIKN